jgi:hypothetical protein
MTKLLIARWVGYGRLSVTRALPGSGFQELPIELYFLEPATALASIGFKLERWIDPCFAAGNTAQVRRRTGYLGI